MQCFVYFKHFKNFFQLLAQLCKYLEVFFFKFESNSLELMIWYVMCDSTFSKQITCSIRYCSENFLFLFLTQIGIFANYVTRENEKCFAHKWSYHFRRVSRGEEKKGRTQSSKKVQKCNTKCVWVILSF